MSTWIKAGFWEKLCKPCKGYKGWLNLDQFFKDSQSYKVYTAQLDQTNSGDPIPTVLENTTGMEFTWSRNDVGNYRASITGTFDATKSYFTSNLSFYCLPYFSYFDIDQLDSSKLILATFDTSGYLELNGRIFVEVRIYK